MRHKSYLKFIKQLFLLLLFTIAVFLTVRAQKTVPASSSEIIGARLPANASRIIEANIPRDVNDALAKIVASGGDKIRQGKTEVLAWANGYKKSNAPNLIKQLTANLQAAGWTYEIGGENDGVTVFAVMTDSPKKRAVVGFYTFSNDALVWAWTEMLAATSDNQNVAPQTVSRADNNGNLRANDSSAKIIDVGKNDGFVNVMGNEMPEMPMFPALKPKPGFVRGYAKD